MPQGTDWVEVWQGLNGSRDFSRVVEAGQQLCNAVIVARRAWVEKSHAHEQLRSELQDTIETLTAQLEDDDSELSIAGAVRAWHEISHVDAWMVCPHMVCRRVVLTCPEITPTTVADVLVDRIGA